MSDNYQNNPQICPSSSEGIRDFQSDPIGIGEAVDRKATTFIAEGLEKFQRPNLGLEVPTGNATEAILKYLDENYKSFNANQDFSYTSLDLKDAQDFVKNIDKAYSEISNYYPDAKSLNTTLAEFLSGNQLAVLPTKGMLRYYNTKNFVTGGLFMAKGFSGAVVSKTLPVAARPSYLFGGGQILGTSFVLGSAFSMLEDATPWRYGKIVFNTLKWTSLLPAKGAESLLNTVVGPIERVVCGIPIPSNNTKALSSGPGLTLRDISRKEVKKALEIALKQLKEMEDAADIKPY